jgi:hypothetical protein
MVLNISPTFLDLESVMLLKDNYELLEHDEDKEEEAWSFNQNFILEASFVDNFKPRAVTDFSNID